jgi:hypothetical protein
MSDFDITVDTDYIANWSAMEVPISGPGDANILLVLTGTAIFGLDVDDGSLATDIRPPLRIDLHPGAGAGDDRPFHGQLLVRTGYLVVPPDRYLNVGGDGTIQQTTHLTLARIEGDDSSGTTTAVDAGDTYVDDRYGRTNPVAIGEVVVRMQLGVQGDCTLDGVAYQVHLLLHKATPSFRTIHPDPQGGVVVGEG